MARFKIYSKDGQSVRYEGKPKYLGVYLNPSCLKFSEISSSEPIAWEVGDYVDYPRTGMRYRLYSIPQPSKEARRGSYGGAFRYSGVELYAATKELEIALFRDLVGNDNNIHFSTSPDVTTFENVHGIARRIQACMDYFYPGRWEIRVADFDADADAEIIEKISTAKDFALSGGTCLDALSKIYELWQDTGWIHSYENGKEVITIGYANKRIDANTTDSYLYGKGNGLTAIKKNQTNKDEFATRLYVYGSERNLPARYYNDKEILNAESVDIRNLMLPLDSWGKTNGLPDARKAYLENAEAVAKFGVIPKTHYFDSEDAGADIYPTIERLTIGEIRSVMQSTDEYYPTDRYADGDRADAVLNTINPTDDGVLKRDGKEYDAVSYISLQSIDKKVHVTGGLNNAPIIINHPLFSKVVDTDFSKGKVVADLSQTITIPDRGYTSVSARVEIGDSEEVGYGASYGYADFVATKSDDGQNWVIKLGRVSVDYSKTIYDTYKFPVYGFVTIDANTIGAESGEITIKFGAGSGSVGIKRVLDKTFIVYLKQIGFNINAQASLGKGKTISMKTGACAGRNFVISDCFYSPTLDAWLITCKRQQDDTLGMLFPNSSYEIAEGDTFVLLDIAMPELYVSVAQNRLLAEGQKLLSRASKIQSNYEPSIDAKVMVESGRTLREGMFMEITDEDVVDNTTDYILIDTLSISEDESAIPTYKVTLRERRKVTYKGTPSATSATETKSVEDETEVQPNVDLTGYAKETYVNDKVSEVNNLLASMWTLDEDGNLVTEKNIIIKKNLTIGGDMASDGEGGQGTVTGVTSIIIDGVPYFAEDGAIDLSEAFEGLDVDVDLSDYYTKSETTGLVNTAIANLVNGAPETLDTLKEVADALAENADVVDALNAAIGNKADKATTLAGYGITDAYTQTVIDEKIGTVSKAVSDLDTKYSPVKTWYDELATLIVKEGSNVRIKTNLVIDGDQSATGEGGGAVSGITGIAVNGQTYTDTNNDGIIDLGTISGGGGINEITYKMVIDALGYTPYNASNPNGYITSAGVTSSLLSSVLGTTGNGGKVLASTNGGFGWVSLPTTLPASDVYAWAKKSSLALADVPDLSSKYLPLSGGTLTASKREVLYLNTTAAYCDLTLQINKVDKAVLSYDATHGVYVYNYPSGKYIGVKDDGTPYYNNGSYNTLIHSGNIGSQSVSHATTTNRFKVLLEATSGDLNTALAEGGIARNYSGGLSQYTNAPEGAGYGVVLELRASFASSLAGQLAWDINHGSTSDVTKNLWWRASDSPNGFKYGKWHQIAFMDSNVASATKLQTERTIWGQSFDGTGNVDGFLTLNYSATSRATGVEVVSTGGGEASIGFKLNDTNRAVVGVWSSALNLWTQTQLTAVSIPIATGNVLIGTTTDSGYKLDVNGVARATGWIGNNVNISCNANGNTSGYSGEINRFGGGKLWIQAREGGLELGNSAGVNFNGAVTMISTLSVTSGVTSTKFLTSGNYGIWRGSSYTTAMTANDIAFYADYFRFECGSKFVKTLEIDERLVTVTGNLIVTGDISA